jgi:hypothetical protein
MDADMLDGNQVRPNQWDMIYLLEHTNNAAVVDARNKNSQEISQ